MFGEFLTDNKYEIEFERLGIRTVVNPLSEDELEECRRMRGTEGARYALYLACPALHEEGERLYKEGTIFSPLDITRAVDAADANAAYRYIREISGMGASRVALYRNDSPVSGGGLGDFVEDGRSLSENGGDGRVLEDFVEDSRDMENGVERRRNAGNKGESRRIAGDGVGDGRFVWEEGENGRNMEKIAEILAYKLRMAAENM